MKARTKLQKALLTVLEEPEFYSLTDAQLQNMRDLAEKYNQYDINIAKVKGRYKGMAVTRIYKIRRYNKSLSVLHYHLCIVRVEKNGEIATAARRRAMNFYLDAFSISSDFIIKDNSDYVCVHYLTSADPISNKRKEVYAYDVKRVIDCNYIVYRDTMAETIDRSPYRAFIDLIGNYRRPLSKPLYTALRICIRNHYEIDHNNIWNYYRYVNLCHINGLDLYNRVIACPDDLERAIAKVIHIDDRRKLRAEANREYRRRQRELKECRNKEDAYLKAKGKYFGVFISDTDFDIHVLQSVSEFVDEAAEMKHCVYVNHYYDKAGSLILSVRDKNGKRIATVEFDLNKMKVLQCQGKSNSKPKGYEHIIKLIEGNAAMIKKAKRKKVA